MAKSSKVRLKKETRVKPLDIFVSVIVVLRSDLIDGVVITDYVEKLSRLLYSHYSNYELIIVDNSLPTDFMKPIVDLLPALPCIRIIQLSRRYSHDTAIMAGLEGSIGDFTVITDPALDPIDDIPRIVVENQLCDIVQGAALDQQRRIHKSAMRRLFYWYSRNYVMVDVPTNATYFISLSRKAVAAITSSARGSVHIRFIIKMVGYSYKLLPYEPLQSPIRNHSLRVGIFEAADIISSYSVHPLRFISWVGLLASVVSIIYALYVVIVTLTFSHVAQGWTTTSLQISGLFFILFLILVVLAEYVGKLLVELRRDRIYHVIDERVSTVSLAHMDRKNVSHE